MLSESVSADKPKMQYLSLRNINLRSKPIPSDGHSNDSSPSSSPRSRIRNRVKRLVMRASILIRSNPFPSAVLGLLILFVLVTAGTRGQEKILPTLAVRSYGFGPRPSKPFIYVYDFGPQLTDAVRKLIPAFYSNVYDAERILLERIRSSIAIRTTDPEKATLFYVPFYSTFYSSSLFRDWEANMDHAVNQTSKTWELLLTRVRQEFPFWNRSNGADHFSVLSMDYGRCTALTFLNPSHVGDMFFITHTGDKLLRSSHCHPLRNLQILAYNYGSPVTNKVPDIICYRSDRDIVIPPPLEVNFSMALSSPLSANRSIRAFVSFKEKHHHGLPVLHANHDIRAEIYQLKGSPGWLFDSSLSEEGLRSTMRMSVFCVCPPGHSQWTSRMTKAILAGCIPVTFFRDNDPPWHENLNYDSFSVNVDPDNIGSLGAILAAISSDQLTALRKTLRQVQSYFVWDKLAPISVEQLTLRKLWQRAQRLKSARIKSASENHLGREVPNG